MAPSTVCHGVVDEILYCISVTDDQANEHKPVSKYNK